MRTIKLTDKEYKLLNECLKWNLYTYEEKISKQPIPKAPIQIKQLENIKKLIQKI